MPAQRKLTDTQRRKLAEAYAALPVGAGPGGRKKFGGLKRLASRFGISPSVVIRTARSQGTTDPELWLGWGI
jgi:hypothetical protein